MTNLPKIVPDSDIKKLKNSQGNKIEEGMRKRKEAKNEDEITSVRKHEDQEDKEGRKKSITPRPESEEGAGGKRASNDRKWPKSTKILVDYFKKLENSSVQSGGKI